MKTDIEVTVLIKDSTQDITAADMIKDSHLENYDNAQLARLSVGDGVTTTSYGVTWNWIAFAARSFTNHIPEATRELVDPGVLYDFVAHVMADESVEGDRYTVVNNGLTYEFCFVNYSE